MFDKSKYDELLQLLLSKGLNPSLDWHETSNPNHLLIRHDIDFSVDYGVELAKFEYDQKIKSTYFFMLTTTTMSISVRPGMPRSKRVSANKFSTIFAGEPGTTSLKDCVPKPIAHT